MSPYMNGCSGENQAKIQTTNEAAKSEEHSEAPSNDISNSQEKNQDQKLSNELVQNHVTML